MSKDIITISEVADSLKQLIDRITGLIPRQDERKHLTESEEQFIARHLRIAEMSLDEVETIVCEVAHRG